VSPLLAAVAEWLDLALEIKAVDAAQRIIEGYASTTGNEDSSGDVIDPGAFADTLADRSPADIPVFIGHQHQDLPVGIPLVVREDDRGLFTRTKILQTQAGDDLLAVAKASLQTGRGLGMSIGYNPVRQTWAAGKNGRQIRHITSLELGEFSYTAIPANQSARIVAVKERKADVDETAWDGNAAMTACESAACYESICAGRREGDPALRSTWALPHHKSPGAPPNAAGVRNSLARLPQTEGLTNKAAAQAHLERHMAAINPDAGKSNDAELDAQLVAISSYLDRKYRWLAPEPAETKAGRTFSAANVAKAKGVAASLRELADQIEEWVQPTADEEGKEDDMQTKDMNDIEIVGSLLGLELALAQSRGGTT
jgi:hypothetical protein